MPILKQTTDTVQQAEIHEAERLSRYFRRRKKEEKRKRRQQRRAHKEVLLIHYDNLTSRQRKSARTQLLIKQDGHCAICDRPEKELKTILCLDHCHKTGHIRGLLCAKCNWMLGLAEDNLFNLQAAMQYLMDSRKGQDDGT